MPLGTLRFACLCGLLWAGLSAQEARVRIVDQVAMPAPIDSNSPAFWRNGQLYWYGSHGGPWLDIGPDQFGPWEKNDVGLSSADDSPKWLESVWPEDDSTVWSWYHAEPIGLVPGSELTAPRISAAVSNDGGFTFRDIGIILASGDPIDPNAQNGFFGGGHGDFSVLLNREKTYFYFFFDNYGGPDESQGVCLARMAYEDRFAPAGHVWKYYHGAWQESGVAGKVTPIFPVQRGWQNRDPDALWGPSVHWNTYLNCYVMLLNHAAGEPGWSQEGVYVSFCYDLGKPESWSKPVRILDKSQFSGWYFFYPQVMGLEARGTDTEAGQTARLYVAGISKWEIDFIAPAPVAEPTGPAESVTPPETTGQTPVVVVVPPKPGLAEF